MGAVNFDWKCAYLKVAATRIRANHTAGCGNCWTTVKNRPQPPRGLRPNNSEQDSIRVLACFATCGCGDERLLPILPNRGTRVRSGLRRPIPPRGWSSARFLVRLAALPSAPAAAREFANSFSSETVGISCYADACRFPSYVAVGPSRTSIAKTLFGASAVRAAGDLAEPT